MQDSRKVGEKSKEAQLNSEQFGTSNELSQHSGCTEERAASACSSAAAEDFPSSIKEGNEEVLFEYIPDSKSKKKKKRKKKKAQTASIAQGSEGEDTGPLPTSTENVHVDEEEDANGGLHLEDKITPVEKFEEHDLQASGTGRKKKKKRKKKKDSVVSEGGLKPGDALREKLDSQDMSASKEVNDRSGIEDQDGGTCNMAEVVPEIVKAEARGTFDGAVESCVDTEHADLLEDDAESDTEDDTSDMPDNEGRNILCIFKLFNGVGLQALRKLFMNVNPTWRNQPTDADMFDKGEMVLNTTKEEEIFNSGDINKWDFSLMTTVLLHSRSCSSQIRNRRGYRNALWKLKEYRNKLMAHSSTDRMSDVDFKHYWPHLLKHFVTLGADPKKIEEIKHQSDEDLYAGGYYRELFLAELTKLNAVCQKVDEVNNKLDTIIACQSSNTTEQKTPLGSKDVKSPGWDEYIKFSDAVGEFDTRKNQYILITDALSPDNLDCFSLLRSVSWKMVLDLDSKSEETGFYHSFTSQEGQGRLVSMVTPAEIKGTTIMSLGRQIDPNKIQWLFVNGRCSDSDGKSETFPDWEESSFQEIARFFVCFCERFDKQKPVICLILPFCRNSVPYLQLTLNRLVDTFYQCNFKIVSFQQDKFLLSVRRVKVHTVDLTPTFVHMGLKRLLCSPSTSRYRMPTSQAKIYAELGERDYLFLKEHLQILYEGCEELPEGSNDPSEGEMQRQKFLDENRKLFMSGNEISFASLYDNHDAKREIGKDIQIHVQRLLDKGLTHSMMVEIKHSPGTGGTTIGRRVMWDLHNAYPCAFIEVSSNLDFEEENSYASKLVERIATLEEICHTSPIVLIDGKQSRFIESVTNKIVRMLSNRGKRALLLCCQHGSKTSAKETSEPSRVHQVFYVAVKLEDSVADLNEFQSKYKEFIESSTAETPASGPCRVFHFPLLAMMEKFHPKLKKIIVDTWNEMDNLQQQIAIVVAFLQKYASQPTPALLLHDAFKMYIRLGDRKNVTYEDIKQIFSEHLLNLMVPSNPLLRQGGMYHLKESSPESYTFQHRLVAELLLEKCFQEQGCDLFQVVDQFLQFPIYRCEDFQPLLEALFVYNKDGQKERKFSVLFEDLKAIDEVRAAEVFRETAEKTGDSIIFANAARFFAKMNPPSFPKAMELIEQAFQASNFKLRSKSICQTKGVVLYFELKHKISSGKIRSLAKLEEQANKVLEAYKEARNFPPTYPNPLLGEVDVWLACLGWIMKKKCDNDSEKTLKFLASLSPPFFRTCVSDSFYLLDIVDGIIQSVPTLPDPEDTQRRCMNSRLSLMNSFSTGSSPTKGRRDAEDVAQAFQALCSAKNFPRSSLLELKRLQAHFILNSSDQIDSLRQENLEFLLKLLEELVFKEREHRWSYHLVKVCVLVKGPQHYSLEQGLDVCDKWLKVSQHDCLPYFYQMAICFLKILDGQVVEFMPKYSKALKMCQEKSRDHCRSSQSTHFVSKEGEGMSRLVTRSTLFRETDYSTDASETVSRFWLVDSRKKLLECKGRIRVGPSSNRGKAYPYIELLQGKVNLYVGKNADIGKVDRDFTKGQLVYFVVSFNLQGPVANGITFSEQNSSPR